MTKIIFNKDQQCGFNNDYFHFHFISLNLPDNFSLFHTPVSLLHVVAILDFMSLFISHPAVLVKLTTSFIIIKYLISKDVFYSDGCLITTTSKI